MNLPRIWAMEANALDELLAGVQRVMANATVEALAAVQPKPPPVPQGPSSVRIIPIRGVMVKDRPAWLVEFFGGTVTRHITAQVRAAAGDPTVGTIIIYVDSPGGDAFGSDELSDEISRAAKRKRVVAVVEDLCCSAAFYAVAGATEIVANRSAWVGSIGAYWVVSDWAAYREKLGVRQIVIRTGEFKGIGLDKITDAQAAELQRIVNTLGYHFTERVAEGRRMTMNAAKELSDGRIFVGQQALERRLVDRIAPAHDTIAAIVDPAAALDRERVRERDRLHAEASAAAAQVKAAEQLELQKKYERRDAAYRSAVKRCL